MNNELRTHVRRCLEANRVYTETVEARVAELERSGSRVIGGGNTVGEHWKITDWRTGETIATGDAGINGYDAAVRRLSVNGTLWHIDCVTNEVPIGSPDALGIPESLGTVIEDWVDTRSTSDEDIASVSEWPIETVHEYRRPSGG